MADRRVRVTRTEGCLPQRHAFRVEFDFAIHFLTRSLGLSVSSGSAPRTLEACQTRYFMSCKYMRPLQAFAWHSTSANLALAPPPHSDHRPRKTEQPAQTQGRGGGKHRRGGRFTCACGARRGRRQRGGAGECVDVCAWAVGGSVRRAEPACSSIAGLAVAARRQNLCRTPITWVTQAGAWSAGRSGTVRWGAG